VLGVDVGPGGADGTPTGGGAGTDSAVCGLVDDGVGADGGPGVGEASGLGSPATGGFPAGGFAPGGFPAGGLPAGGLPAGGFPAGGFATGGPAAGLDGACCGRESVAAKGASLRAEGVVAAMVAAEAGPDHRLELGLVRRFAGDDLAGDGFASDGLAGADWGLADDAADAAADAVGCSGLGCATSRDTGNTSAVAARSARTTPIGTATPDEACL
jgi:hypothetical protein